MTSSRSPNAVVRLVRNDDESPYYAKFEVPLNWGKMDLRDYLYNAYNVEALRVRSHVYQEPVKRMRAGADPRKPQIYYGRPQSKKYMTIFMRDPFVWPKEPENFEA